MRIQSIGSLFLNLIVIWLSQIQFTNAVSPNITSFTSPVFDDSFTVSSNASISWNSVGFSVNATAKLVLQVWTNDTWNSVQNKIVTIDDGSVNFDFDPSLIPGLARFLFTTDTDTNSEGWTGPLESPEFHLIPSIQFIHPNANEKLYPTQTVNITFSVDTPLYPDGAIVRFELRALSDTHDGSNPYISPNLLGENISLSLGEQTLSWFIDPTESYSGDDLVNAVWYISIIVIDTDIEIGVSDLLIIIPRK